MTRYRFKSGDESVHELDLLIEDKFGPIYTWLQQQVVLGAGHEAKPRSGRVLLQRQLRLDRGAQYRQNDIGEIQAPQLGAQTGIH